MKAWPKISALTHKLKPSGLPMLPRVVIGLGLGVAVLVVLGSATAQTRPILIAVAALAVLVVAEIWRRRRWEKSTTAYLARLDDDSRRVMRDVARQRQENVQLRGALAGAGETLSLQNRHTPQDGNLTTEQRMLRTIAAELSRLSIPAEPDNDGDALTGVTELELAMIEHHASAAGKDASLSSAHIAQLVKAAIDQDRIDLFTQPIVTLPQRKTRFVEAYARIRIRAGVHMSAERYIDVAREQNLLPAIDNLLLLESLKALRAAADGDSGVAYFCNITSLTLHDPKFMTDLVEFIAQNRTLAQRLVFELTQHDLVTMRADVVPVLAGLARLGCRFSLDQVRELSINASELAARYVRFVKIDAAVLNEHLRKAGGADRIQQLKAALDFEGIDMIAERVENEKQVVELLDVGIDYGQGYLFGHPQLQGEGQ